MLSILRSLTNIAELYNSGNSSGGVTSSVPAAGPGSSSGSRGGASSNRGGASRSRGGASSSSGWCGDSRARVIVQLLLARAATLAPSMSCHQLVMMVGYASRLGVPVDVGWMEAVQGAIQRHLEAAVQGSLQPHLEAAALQSDGAEPALPVRPLAVSAISSDAEASKRGGGIGLRDTTRLMQVRGGGGGEGVT